MPKPVKKPVRKLKAPPKPKRPSDPNRAAHAQIAEHIRRMAEGEPAPAPEPEQAPSLKPADIISAHMAKLGAKGGKISGARRMENLTNKQRRDIAMKAAKTRWGKRSGAKG